MLSPQLRRKVHDLWSLFWSSGLSNPLVAIEQITYLLFIRQLEALDRERVKAGKRSIYDLTLAEEETASKETAKTKGKKPSGASNAGTQSANLGPLSFPTSDPKFQKCRWSYIRQNVSFALLNDTVFPWLRELEKRVGPAQNGNTTLGRISGRLSDAYFILDPNKSDTLKRAVSLIDELFRQLDARSVNSDIMGDIFEYLLEEVKEAGKNGQFRTPRHIIRFMVELLNPELGKTVIDPACGSGGFLLNTLLHWKAENTDKDVLRLEWDGTPHDVLPNWPKGKQPDFNTVFRGYDNDRTMVRIAWMNLLLHDLESPEIHQLDALSKRLGDDQSGTYDTILANPPFTGSVDEGDLSENRQRFTRHGKAAAPLTTKSELLFAWLMLDLLKIGGRAAVIVPDGVLFGGTNAHVELRRQLLFENTLEAIVSLPANIFQPYSGVKTSIIVFQKAGTPVAKGDDPRTREVWFYEITDEAYTLDQRRKPRQGHDNDLWDALEKFRAWTRYRTGEVVGKKAATARAESIATDYHQPEYWEERWRAVDDEFLKIFPEKSGDKGRTFAIHQLWPTLNQTPKNSAQKIAESQRKPLATVLARIVANAITNTAPAGREVAAEKAMRQAISRLNAIAKDEGLLDREFDQFGANELRALVNSVSVEATKEALEALKTKKQKPIVKPATDACEHDLRAIITEFAKLDGYNVWRRSNSVARLPGKLIVGEDGTAARVPSTQSWIVPVRKWAERENWGEDPATKQPILKPTHKNGIVDPAYLLWLRDTLKVFDDDATVKKEHRDRLDPECLEALDFNLSAGRHKPFVFDPGQHRPPAELIHELQAIHGEVQTRLGKLLGLVENADSKNAVNPAVALKSRKRSLEL